MGGGSSVVSWLPSLHMELLSLEVTLSGDITRGEPPLPGDGRRDPGSLWSQRPCQLTNVPPCRMSISA